MFDVTLLSAAFVLGLLSSAHCLGMCGGIMGALTMAIPRDAHASRWLILLFYNLARITSYACIGLLAGAAIGVMDSHLALQSLRVVAGILLIGMGLYLANWWRGLIYLERAGQYLWAYVQPLSKPFLPVNSIWKAIPLGFIWGWLPCGLVYSALGLAISQGQAVMSASVMLAFGLGTLPTVLASGIAAQWLGRWLTKPVVRWPMAIAIMLFGVWTIVGAAGHQHGHSSHQGEQSHSHSSSSHGADEHASDHSGHSGEAVAPEPSHHQDSHHH